MRQKKFWFALSGVLAVLAMVLVLPAGAGAASKYKVLHMFRYRHTDGTFPLGRMVFDTAGNLYGTTGSGGASNGGTVFKLTPNSDGSWTERALYSFCSLKNCIDGDGPLGLIFDAAGNLYSTTEAGGGGSISCPGYGCGTAFRLTPNSDGTWRESVLHGFKGGGDGKFPRAGLVFDAVGNLYGTTLSTGGCCGSGMVFQLTPNSDGTWTENVLYRFRGGTDGRYPSADLIFDAAGNLYGTTDEGGGKCHDNPVCGTVFKLTPNSDGTWMESVLYRFRGGTDGRNPSARLIFDAAGNLYGTAFSGGRGGSGCCGVIFKLTPNSDGTWTETVLHRFTGGSDGSGPNAELIFDAAGNLYGTTEAGGAYGYGVVFELMLTSTGWRERVLHAFASNPASTPVGGLTLDKAGNLYGTTYDCGSGEACRGVVFEVTP